MSGLMKDGFMNNTCLPQNNPSQPVYDTTFDVKVVETSQFDQSTKIATSADEPSMNKKLATVSSTLVDKIESGEQVTQKVTSMEKKRKNIRRSSFSSAQSKNAKEGRNKLQKKTNDVVKEEENKGKAEKKDQKKVTLEPPTGYIHVRARRGQATDSHSIAERVRREKISERMKILQGLVPGCDKVTGKALMLDEIINYVQSLQNQVEFLSMKLASVNPLFCEFGVDLDASMVMPHRLTSMESALRSMQNCSPSLPTALIDANTTATAAAIVPTTNYGTASNYPMIDSSISLLLQEQRLTDFTQDIASLLWDLEEQRQKYLNPSWFNNLGSFH